MKRRDFLTKNVAIAGATLGTAAVASRAATAAVDDVQKQTPSGRVRQSVMGWCFNPMGGVELAKHCKRIGIEAIEGISSKDYDEVTKLGVKISLVGSHGFAKGPLDPDNHAEVEKKLRDGIDLAVKYNAPNVITFTGMKTDNVNDEAAFNNCISCWKRVMPYAEQNGIGLVLEHLNSVDDTHPMKGHPGYWGDDMYRCLDLVKAVGSPKFKLLFDVYHVQAMHGDVIRKIRRYHEFVGHYHTAGNPGRGELDDTQEINYPPVIRAIVETGYSGYIAQEFIPTSSDPIQSLQQAYDVCNV